MLSAGEFSDDGDEDGRFERFREVLLEARGERALDVLLAGESAQGGGGNVAAVGQRADVANQFVAVVVRHADVTEDDMGAVGLENGEGAGDVAADVNLGAVVAEDALHEAGGIGFVFDDENDDSAEVDVNARRIGGG